MQQRRMKGFVLSEYLISLLAGSILMTTIVVSIALAKEGLHFSDILQDEIGMYQIRRILLLSYDVTYSEDELFFEYQKETYTMSYINGNIVIRPGTQIVLTNVDNAYFVLNEERIYLLYEREGTTYERLLY